MLRNSARKEARGKFDVMWRIRVAWRAQEVWLWQWCQFESVLCKVIMQRTAGRIMRWSSNTCRGLVGPQIISLHMDASEAEGADGGRGGGMQMLHVYGLKQQQIKGTALLWIFLQEFLHGSG